MESTFGLIVGSGWAAGVNLYAVVALLGVFGRLGLGDVPDALMRTEVIAVAAVLYAVEFLADKVPYLDNLWDVIHTVVRPVGAGVLGVLLAGDTTEISRLLAGGGSGLLALASHATKATSRVAINASPEPASNIIVSLFEDGLVAGVVFLAVQYPVAAAIVVAILLVASVALLVALWRAARRAAGKIRERLRARRTGSPTPR